MNPIYEEVIFTKQFYLAHQLKYRQLVRDVELAIEKQFQLKLINPFYDTGRTDILDLDAGKIKDRYSFTLQECNKTVDADLKLIDSCDGVVCILLDGDAIGSFMEIFYASKILGKPVYLICPQEKIARHLWIRSLAWKIFNNIVDFCFYVKENREDMI